MDYFEAKVAYEEKRQFELPLHLGAGQSTEEHAGTGRIITLGENEVELLCDTCHVHMLGTLANIEIPEEITYYPGHHIIE